MFEGSFFQGGGGWEHIDVRGDLAGIRSAACGYVLEGWWAMEMQEDCRLAVYESGTLRWEHDLYPHTRVKVPGLTEVSFGRRGERIGGLAEPGGKYGGLDEDALWRDHQIAGDIARLGAENPGAISVDIDWDAIAAPALTGPALRDDGDVVLNEDTGRYAVIGADATVGDLRRAWTDLAAAKARRPAEQPAGLSDSEPLPEGLRDELIEELECAAGGRLLAYGHNSMFDPY